jgi:hypothetical protein
MYTFNLFCFGHELGINKELNNSLSELDIDETININGREFEFRFPYHGGQVDGDTFSCVFGTVITDDDGNRAYTKEIREAKEEDYKEDYNKFLTEFIDRLNKSVEEFKEYDDKEAVEIIEKFIQFLKENEPCFYSVEASS